MKLNQNDNPTTLSNQEKRLIKAKRQVQRIKMFYLHLALYSIVVALISYNFYILEEGPYTDNITALNISVVVLWTAFLGIHAWRVFKGKLLFNQRWEDKKIENILNEKNKTTFWE